MFTGIWPALVTPLDAAGAVDVKATEALVADLITTGIGGLYVCGGTGEGVLLAPAVRQQMAEVAIGLVAGQVPVMVHVGAINTQTALELAEHAEEAGADAISAVPPFYYGYPFPAILDYYRAISQATALPLYVYYIPGATGNAISVDQLLEICALENVAGLKYTSQDMFYLARLLARRDPTKVNVLAGPDELFLPCLALGVEGAIGTTYNFMPRLYLDIMQSCLKGDLPTARKLQCTADDIILAMLPYGIIPATKALLGMLGYHVGQGVPPMPAITGEEERRLRLALEEAGLFGLLRRSALHGPAGDPGRWRLA
jgi:N-acetylneuraminate lyase